MKRKERIAEFHSFYQKNYNTAMNDILCKTGDFLNAEELLEKAFIKVYKYFVREKVIQEDKAQKCLISALKATIAEYDKKHSRVKTSSGFSSNIPLADLLDSEFDLSLQIAEKKGIIQDILAFVSNKPRAIRRAFTYYIYFDFSLQEIAEELKLPKEEIENDLSSLLAEIKELILAEYEKEEDAL